MINIQELDERLKREMRVDQTKLDSEIMRILALRHEMMGLLVSHLSALREMSLLLDVTRLDRWKYYKNEYPQLLQTKSDLETHINADEKWQRMKRRENRLRAAIDYLEHTVKELDQLVWACRDSMKFKMFLGGSTV